MGDGRGPGSGAGRRAKAAAHQPVWPVIGGRKQWVRARDAVARLVVELAGSPAPGGLRDVLAGTLGDPSLQLAYPLAAGSRVDAPDGRCPLKV